MLLRSPGFSIVAILSLALGIGANSTIFSFTNAYLLRPLPYKDYQQLRFVQGVEIPSQRISRLPNYGELLAWRDASQTAQDFVGTRFSSFNVSDTVPPEQVLGMEVSAGFFELLSVQPYMGRPFTQEDDTPGGKHVAILSYGYWQRTGARQDILGRTIHLNGEPYSVVGVMPESFRFPNPEWQIWTPLGIAATQTGRQQTVAVMFRVRSTATAQAAAAELGEIARRTVRSDSAASGIWQVETWSLYELLNHVPQAKPSILVLTAAAAFVLLIACANLANLLLARSTVRRKEIAIRTAIGAGRGHLLQQLLIEACLLSLCGGALGALLAFAGIRALVAVCPTWMLPVNGVQVNGTVLLFTAAASVAAGLLFGIVPALQSCRQGPAEALKEGGRSAYSGGRHWLRRVLVASEMSAAAVLLIGAGLLIRTLSGTNSDLGFRTENLLTMDVALPGAKYTSPGSTAAFYREVVSNIGSIPGVISAGASGRFGRFTVLPDGRAVPVQGEQVLAISSAITPDYFATLGVPLRSGRFFQSADSANSQPVAIVNEALARRTWPGEPAVGHTIKLGTDDQRWETIVGVVADTKGNPLDKARPEAYLPHEQQATRSMQLVIRTHGDPGEFAKAARLKVAAVDPHQAVTNVRTMDELMAFQISPQRVTTGLLAVFAAVALVLAATGTYGVTAYAVSQRTQEFGVRVALGASRGSIARIVVREVATLAAAGLAAGLVLAFGLTRLMKAILFGVSATDPLTFVAVPVLLSLIALSAAYVPAHRATQVDPLKALRCD
jgi:putative ABC transport system permease protein